MTIFVQSSVKRIEILLWKMLVANIQIFLIPKSDKWHYKNHRFSIHDLVNNIKRDIYQNRSDAHDLCKKCYISINFDKNIENYQSGIQTLRHFSKN